jgi:hypothetical protein
LARTRPPFCNFLAQSDFYQLLVIKTSFILTIVFSSTQLLFFTFDFTGFHCRNLKTMFFNPLLAGGDGLQVSRLVAKDNKV